MQDDNVWRPEPESNRGARICSPLRNHSATRPRGSEQAAADTGGITIRIVRPQASPANSRPSSEISRTGQMGVAPQGPPRYTPPIGPG